MKQRKPVDVPEGRTRAQVEAMLKAGTWWPFTRVDSTILEKVTRANKRNENATTEEALL